MIQWRWYFLTDEKLLPTADDLDGLKEANHPNFFEFHLRTHFLNPATEWMMSILKQFFTSGCLCSFGKNKFVFFCSESNVMSKTTFVCDTDSCMHNPQRWKGGRGAQVDRKMIIDCLPDSCYSTSATMWKSLQASKVAKFRAACPHPYPFSQPYNFTAISLPWLGLPIWNFFLKIDYTPSFAIYLCT